MDRTDETRLMGYVARFQREVVRTNPDPTGFDDLLDWLSDQNDWELTPAVISVARREWMRG